MARRYRFHCLGSSAAELDPHGSWMASMTDVRLHADRVALALMTGGDRLDWTDWVVDVRDAAGRRVLLRAFVEVRVSGRRA